MGDFSVQSVSRGADFARLQGLTARLSPADRHQAHFAFPSNVILESCAEEAVPVGIPTPLQWIRGVVPQYIMLEQCRKDLGIEPELEKASQKKVYSIFTSYV